MKNLLTNILQNSQNRVGMWEEEKLSNGSIKKTFFKRINFVKFG